MRLINADAFVQFLKDTVIRQRYETLKIGERLTVGDVIDAVICDLDGTGLDGLKNAPTIEERKTGRWIAVNDAYNRISGKCSACGWEAHMYEDDVVGMGYCPNCGAKMENCDG